MGGKDVHVNSASRRDNNYVTTCQSSVQDARESLSRRAEGGNAFQTHSETYRYAVDKRVGGERMRRELICTLVIVVESSINLGRGAWTRQMSREVIKANAVYPFNVFCRPLPYQTVFLLDTTQLCI